MLDNSISSQELSSIIKNTDKRYSLNNKDYILILYISDCEEAIWQKTFDPHFLAALGHQQHITSSLTIFASTFIQSLKTNSHLQRERNTLRIHIKLQIGDGIVMSCSILVENRIHYNNPDLFKKALRKFTVLLWEVKQAQVKLLDNNRKKQIQEIQKKAEEVEENQKKARSRMTKKAPVKNNLILKKGDLMNPQRKKRKTLGAKFGSGYEDDMFPPSVTPGISQPLERAKQ